MLSAKLQTSLFAEHWSRKKLQAVFPANIRLCKSYKPFYRPTLSPVKVAGLFVRATLGPAKLQTTLLARLSGMFFRKGGRLAGGSVGFLDRESDNSMSTGGNFPPKTLRSRVGQFWPFLRGRRQFRPITSRGEGTAEGNTAVPALGLWLIRLIRSLAPGRRFPAAAAAVPAVWTRRVHFIVVDLSIAVQVD
jgi:hypothetical protein